MFNRRQILANAVAASLASLATGRHALAQMVQRTARIVVGFPAGGTTDTLARVMAERLRGAWAPTVVVDIRAGASGRIALTNANNNDTDGSVAFLTPCSLLFIFPHVFRRLAYDPVQDFAPVSTIARGEFAFSVGPMVPSSVRTLANFVTWARANPRQAFFASPAPGATPHFVGLMFAQAAGIELTHATYRGDAPGIQDLLGGHIASSVNNIGVVLPHLRSGALRVLATSGVKRSPFTPNVPTFVEAGFKDLQAQEWFGFLMPSRVGKPVVDGFAKVVADVVKQPEVVRRFGEFSFEAVALETDEFAALLKSERERWAPIVQASGFRLDE